MDTCFFMPYGACFTLLTLPCELNMLYIVCHAYKCLHLQPLLTVHEVSYFEGSIFDFLWILVFHAVWCLLYIADITL
jgi:hypothetical protein